MEPKYTAHAIMGIFRKTYYMTFGTSSRHRLYRDRRQDVAQEMEGN